VAKAKRKHHENASQETPDAITERPDDIVSTSINKDGVWVTDGGWKSGITGALTIVLVAYYYHAEKVLNKGISLFGHTFLSDRKEGILFACFLVCLTMIVVETLRLWRFYGKSYISLNPELKAGNYSKFLLQCLKSYLLLLMLFLVSVALYKIINEYGFQRKASYYQPWFFTVGVLLKCFIFGAPFYIILTRAFKHDDRADKKDLAALTEKGLAYLCSPLLKMVGVKRAQFTVYDRRAALGWGVKFFFAPVMTVFFFDNFGTLVNNMDYLFGGFLGHIRNGTYSEAIFKADLGNVATSFIFTIDVGLAWVGYILSSRWLDNSTASAEPTLGGWIVCLLSYPPFRIIPGWFFSGPGEKMYMNLPDQTLVYVFGVMMTISYFIYMLPTIWFGTRFSNLTNRGIIRKGPFAVVRHPAYASKNFAWWCVGFPIAAYMMMFTDNTLQGFLYIVGLICLTAIYYMRAITEENHLKADPAYREYCKKVKYRFFPKLI